jgi:hypothetical protein
VKSRAPSRPSPFPSRTSFSAHAPRKNLIRSPRDGGRFELPVRFAVSVSPSYSSTTR